MGQVPAIKLMNTINTAVYGNRIRETVDKLIKVK